MDVRLHDDIPEQGQIGVWGVGWLSENVDAIVDEASINRNRPALGCPDP
jgi:hypothetical protein